LVILGEVRYQQLKALIKEPRQKIKTLTKKKKNLKPLKPVQFPPPDFSPQANSANLNTEPRTKIIPAWIQEDDRLFGDLNPEEQRTLHNLLKGNL
jgi:hypothetical protein